MDTKKHHVVLLMLLTFALLHVSPSTACSYCPTPKPPPPPPPSTIPCPPPPYSPSPSGKCPIDALKLAACVDVLAGLVHVVVGGQASQECCPLLSGVADLDAALCLCTTIKAKALVVSVVLPIALEVLVNDCGKHVPSNFQCP